MRRTPSQGRNNNEGSPSEMGASRGGAQREFKTHYQGGHEESEMGPRSSRPGISGSQFPRLSGPPPYSSGMNGDRRMSGFGGAPMTHRGGAPSSDQFQQHDTETRLPNDVRLSSQGSVQSQISFVLRTLSEGYEHCKVVGRGQATKNVL